MSVRGGGSSAFLLSSMHPSVGVAWLSMASACVRTAAELCLFVGGLIPGTHPPLSRWQTSTYGLFMATDEHLSDVLLARALALP